MEPRHVLAHFGCAQEFIDDLIERHRCRVDDTRAGRAVSKQSPRHQRSSVKTDGAARDEIAPAHRDEVRCPWPSADEMDGHRPSPTAMAQVAPSKATRGPRRRPLRPAAAKAA